MFIENEIKTIKQYDGWLLNDKQQKVLHLFMNENEDNGCVCGSDGDESKWIWVFESLEIVNDEYFETKLTKNELTELKNILSKAKNLGIHKITF